MSIARGCALLEQSLDELLERAGAVRESCWRVQSSSDGQIGQHMLNLGETSVDLRDGVHVPLALALQAADFCSQILRPVLGQGGVSGVMIVIYAGHNRQKNPRPIHRTIESPPSFKVQ